MGGLFGGGWFGGGGNGAYNVPIAGDNLITGDTKSFSEVRFDAGGSGIGAKIYYYTRIAKLQEKIKKSKAITGEIVKEFYSIVNDLLCHRHVYSGGDTGFIAFGNIPISPTISNPNRLSGYPSQMNNQVLYGPPYILGKVSERWFKVTPETNSPELIEGYGVLKYQTLTDRILSYGSINDVPSQITSYTTENFAVIIDMFLNFNVSELGKTKYFFTTHDDSVLIYVDGNIVYNRTLTNGRPAFSLDINSERINRPIPVKIIWNQTTGPCNFILKMSDYFGSTMAEYSTIPGSVVSTLTPISKVEPTDAKNISFYTLIQQLSILTHHNHPYTDYGLSGAEYSSIKDNIVASANFNKLVPLVVNSSLTTQSYIYTPPESKAEQLPDGSAHVVNVNTDFVDTELNKEVQVFDITISPFSVNI